MKKFKLALVAVVFALGSAFAADSLSYFIVYTPGGGSKRIAPNVFEQQNCRGINTICAQEYQDNQLLVTIANGPYTGQ